MHAFIDHPDQRQLLVDDPAAHRPGAVDEILRWASPVMYFRRNGTKDTEVRGQTIRDGDKISLWYISANRDEDVFDDPFRFDITRDPNEHVAFGGGGPHFCLGAKLARLEIRVMFEELATRVPRIELAGPADRLRSQLHRRHQAPARGPPRRLKARAAGHSKRMAWRISAAGGG